MDLTLNMFRDDGAHRAFPITKRETVIGRREDCDLRVAIGNVSRKHSRVVLEGEVVRIEDLGSSNGTYVNGKKVRTSPLAAGDVVQIGPVTFVVQVGGNPSADSFAGRVDAIKKASAPKTVEKPKAKAAAIDGDIDELEILNDSAGGSGINVDLDDSRP